jgi:hypothetical protein
VQIPRRSRSSWSSEPASVTSTRTSVPTPTDAATGGDVEPRARQIEALIDAGRYPAGATVPAAARGFAAFERGDYPAAIAALESMVAERMRMAGSRAQLDLVEFTLLKAYLAAGRREEAGRLIAAHRPGPGAIPVAGVP